MNDLTAPEGFYYTQVNLTNEDCRIFTNLVILGITDSSDNWKLVPESEKLSWEADRDAKLEELRVGLTLN